MNDQAKKFIELNFRMVNLNANMVNVNKKSYNNNNKWFSFSAFIDIIVMNSTVRKWVIQTNGVIYADNAFAQLLL